MTAIKIKSINHVCLVVRDQAQSEQFYMNVVGLQRHHKIKSWLVIDGRSTLHLVEIPEAGTDNTLYHEIQHFALEVEDLSGAYRTLLKAGLAPFQMDFSGVENPLTDPDDQLTYGLGTVFVRDPDGNLVEFLEEGRGIFTRDMRPQTSG